MKHKFLFLLAFLAIIVVSCNSEYSGYKKTKTGLYYKVLVNAKDTMRPDTNDVVTLHLKYFNNETDSLLYDSETQLHGPVHVIISPQFKGDIFEGMMMMGKGDSMSFLVRADSLMKYRMLPAQYDSTGMIRFEIRMDSIQRYADYMAEQEFMRQQQERELEELKSMEVEDIQSYVEKNPGFAGPKGRGYYLKVTKTGSGATLKEGQTLLLEFECTLINGIRVASTDIKGEEMNYALGTHSFFADWDDALLGLKKGAEAVILLPSSMALGREGAGEGLVPPYAPLLFTVKIKDAMTAEAYQILKNKKEEQRIAAEKVEIEKYMKANNLSGKPSSTGLIYIPKVEGKGVQAAIGKKVKVHYTGKLLSGVQFDSSYDREEPFEFNLGKQEVIEGWDEGIALMKAGGEAILIVPSHLAYGAEGRGNVIKPNSTLVFEVKLIEVK